MDGNEYGVVTITTKREGERHAFRRKPCSDCPWRRDAKIGAFPAEAYRHSAPTSYDQGMSTFACHQAGKDKPQTCAGFLLRNAEHSLQVRLDMMMGRYDPSLVSDDGIALYDSYREMAVANGVPPDDPIIAPCRANNE